MTKFEIYKKKLLNEPFVAIVAVIFLIVTSLGLFTDSIQKIKIFYIENLSPHIFSRSAVETFKPTTTVSEQVNEWVKQSEQYAHQQTIKEEKEKAKAKQKILSLDLEKKISIAQTLSSPTDGNEELKNISKEALNKNQPDIAVEATQEINSYYDKQNEKRDLFWQIFNYSISHKQYNFADEMVHSACFSSDSDRDKACKILLEATRNK